MSAEKMTLSLRLDSIRLCPVRPFLREAGTVRNFVWRVGCTFELGGFHSITEHDGELRSGLIPFA